MSQSSPEFFLEPVTVCTGSIKMFIRPGKYKTYNVHWTVVYTYQGRFKSSLVYRVLYTWDKTYFSTFFNYVGYGIANFIDSWSIFAVVEYSRWVYRFTFNRVAVVRKTMTLIIVKVLILLCAVIFMSLHLVRLETFKLNKRILSVKFVNYYWRLALSRDRQCGYHKVHKPNVFIYLR